MKKALSILFILYLMMSCAARPPLTPEMQRISSVTDTSSCQFIRHMYTETQPYNLAYYLILNTHNAGGDSYKVISSNTQMVAGVNIMMTNFEVYKCRQ